MIPVTSGFGALFDTIQRGHFHISRTGTGISGTLVGLAQQIQPSPNEARQHDDKQCPQRNLTHFLGNHMNIPLLKVRELSSIYFPNRAPTAQK